MQRDARAFLWDMQEAAALVAQFIAGKSFDAYSADVMLRSAVERQLQNLGEALVQLNKVDKTLAQRIPDCNKIIAFRNVLVHGYTEVKQDRLWDSAQAGLPKLQQTVASLLAELGPPGP